MKKFTLFLTLALVLSILAGCAGTPVVYYSNCTCPTEGNGEAATDPVENRPVVTEGALKTGLYIETTMADSVPATAEKEGEVKYDVTVVAVTVDENGVIVDCILDSLQASIQIDANGAIVSDLTAEVPTKTELGDAYNMKLYGGAKYEWYEQAAALANYACGKTLDELRHGAVNESGKAADADLASVATIYLGGYVNAIERAYYAAEYLGAQAGDELHMSIISSLEGTAATAEKDGNAQLNVDVAAITMNGDTITSCTLDAVQAKVPFTAAGALSIGTDTMFSTKKQLGEQYGMKAWGGARFEWFEQANNFAAYITGKTPAEVAGIAVTETTKPADGTDLATSVTITIGGFQALIAKAAK